MRSIPRFSGVSIRRAVPVPRRCSARADLEGVFPPETPTRDLDTAKLARLNLSGGLIRNVAMNAAFLAADDREPVSMRHLAAAARSEHAKMEKPLNEAEIGTWR